MSFQEYTIADAVQVAKVCVPHASINTSVVLATHARLQVPSNISWEGAATIPLGFATAALGLYQELRPRGGVALTAPWEEGGYKKYAGQAAIVTGGASSVGQFGSLSYYAETCMTRC